MTTTRKPAAKKAASTATGAVTGMTLAERRKAEAAVKAPKAPRSAQATATVAKTTEPTTTEPKAPKAPRTVAATEGELTCRICGQTLPVTKFPTKAPAKDGTVARDDRCRSCRDAAKKAAKTA